MLGADNPCVRKSDHHHVKDLLFPFVVIVVIIIVIFCRVEILDFRVVGVRSFLSIDIFAFINSIL